MDIVKIIGVGLTATIIILVIKQYKPEFAIYASIIAGAIILFMVMDKLNAIIKILQNLANKSRDGNCIFGNTFKNYWNRSAY